MSVTFVLFFASAVTLVIDCASSVNLTKSAMKKDDVALEAKFTGCGSFSFHQVYKRKAIGGSLRYPEWNDFHSCGRFAYREGHVWNVYEEILGAGENCCYTLTREPYCCSGNMFILHWVVLAVLVLLIPIIWLYKKFF